MKELDGQKRVVIEHVKPEIECGRYPAKRVIGEKVTVTADVFADGHDVVKASLLYKHEKSKSWKEVPMIFLGNDQWEASFVPDKQGRYNYTVQGYIDHFTSWKKGLQKKYEANQELEVEFKIGSNLIKEAASNASDQYKNRLMEHATALEEPENTEDAVSIAFEEEISRLMDELYNRSFASQYPRVLSIDVERKKALFSTWYEFFPRSAAEQPGMHGTFKDCIRLLPRIQEMGFDVLYLPPIYPIGRSHRKGKNNAVTSVEGDPGSPWAIGAEEGGHKGLHTELGSLDDFKALVKAANEHGIEIALDIAYQCAPDHPYVKDHPDWFKWRPDGTVQYAENPPKKYQDVLPINFETDDWQNLWIELRSVMLYWIEQGVNIFRVDNPHTKPFGFWEWAIQTIRQEHPDVIFLAEAFTKPRVMERLGKIGFTQSYTYFTWRNTKEEITEYLTELTQTDMRDYYRPNFWPNTPDILPEIIQNGGGQSAIQKVILAGTLSSSYGLYGPVYEYGVNEPVPGREEYLYSEKYEIKHWDWNMETRTRDVITLLNRIRNDNPALQTTWNIHFGKTDNDQIICYAKTDDEQKNILIMAVNLDPYHTQDGYIQVPLHKIGLSYDHPYTVYDLLSDEKYQWQGEWNYVKLNPHMMPAHIFLVQNAVKVKRELKIEEKKVH